MWLIDKMLKRDSIDSSHSQQSNDVRLEVGRQLFRIFGLKQLMLARRVEQHQFWCHDLQVSDCVLSGSSQPISVPGAQRDVGDNNKRQKRNKFRAGCCGAAIFVRYMCSIFRV